MLITPNEQSKIIFTTIQNSHTQIDSGSGKLVYVCEYAFFCSSLLSRRESRHFSGGDEDENFESV
jgi:hypothetical protein